MDPNFCPTKEDELQTMSKKAGSYFEVNYRDPVEGKNVSLKAGKIEDSSLGLSFIRLSDFFFDTSSLVIKPEEENMKKRFEKIKSLHLSIYTVVSIAEIGKAQEGEGLSFKTDRSNLVVLPGAKPPVDPSEGK